MELQWGLGFTSIPQRCLCPLELSVWAVHINCSKTAVPVNAAEEEEEEEEASVATLQSV